MKNYKINHNSILIFTLSFFILIFTFSITVAQTMSSSNYSIQSDSLNFGGGYSSSTSYLMEDTLGEIATGISSSTNYADLAGYQQMHATVLSIVPAGNVTMSPNIGGLSGGTANGSTAFTVMTDNPAGYSATITASSSPALKISSDSFADYVPAGAVPDYSFSNAAVASSFAFSPEGNDVATRFKNNASSVCGTGSLDTADACWDGLSTSATTVVSRTSANHPSGTVTTLKFRAASGSSHIQTEGIYSATTTVTVVAL